MVVQRVVVVRLGKSAIGFSEKGLVLGVCAGACLCEYMCVFVFMFVCVCARADSVCLCEFGKEREKGGQLLQENNKSTNQTGNQLRQKSGQKYKK